MKTKLILSLLFSLVLLTAQAQVYTKQQIDNGFLPKSYSVTQGLVDQDQTDAIGQKANVNDVYTKGQTFTQQQVNNLVSPKADQTAVYTKGQTFTQQQVQDLVVAKMDFQKVASFALAKTNSVVGTPKQFFIVNNELYGGTVGNPTPTNSTYDGTNWNHSPALTQNN